MHMHIEKFSFTLQKYTNTWTEYTYNLFLSIIR